MHVDILPKSFDACYIYLHIYPQLVDVYGKLGGKLPYNDANGL